MIIKEVRPSFTNEKMHENLPNERNVAYADFRQERRFDKIYQIYNIIKMIVTIGFIINPKLILQWRYQEYEHTQKLCNKMPKSDIWVEEHLTKKFKIPKRINHNEEHLVSYSGCQVAKKLEIYRDETTRRQHKVVHKRSALKHLLQQIDIV